jgi:hypothetical protein
VIQPSQIHVAVVSHGPSPTMSSSSSGSSESVFHSRVPMNTTYKNTNDPRFQDSVGLALLQVCAVSQEFCMKIYICLFFQLN